MNREQAPRHVKRSFSAEIRAEARDGGLPTLRGHAAVFNSLSEDFGGWRERIAPGAFDGVIDSPDIYALWNHLPEFIIAATADGSLRLSQDNTGLLSEMDPMDTQTIRDLVVTPIQQGKVRKMSFAFDIPVGGDEWTIEEGTDIRNIKRVGRLYDVSPVTYPAYPGTDISARSLQAIIRALPRSVVLSALDMPMDQESCEAEGGTWDSDLQMCVMTAASARAQASTTDGMRTSTDAGASDEIYRLRVRRHSFLITPKGQLT